MAAFIWIAADLRAILAAHVAFTAEADYTALHASMLYGERGLKFQGDPYEVDNFPRNQIKLGFTIALNARNKRAAVGALAHDGRISRAHAGKLLAAIEKRHKPIGEAFCTDAGVRLMRIDSELILGVLKAVNNEGIGGLPIHDALIAPARSIGLVEEKMVEAFETLVGRVNPCQVKIKGIKVPHMGEGVGLPPDFPSTRCMRSTRHHLEGKTSLGPGHLGHLGHWGHAGYSGSAAPVGSAARRCSDFKALRRKLDQLGHLGHLGHPSPQRS